MSRRKQAKPQQLRSEDEANRRTGAERPQVTRQRRRNSSEETHICDKCCAEFFSWTELSEHRKVCFDVPAVLAMKDNLAEDSALEPSPTPSEVSSDSSAAESTDAGFEMTNDSLDYLEDEREWDESMELEPSQQDRDTSIPQRLDSAKSSSSQASTTGSYSLPSTNVTLEILHSTRVAVAQFSQGINGIGPGGKAASAAIPVILEHLLALQQQQVHQLQLIEQICSQVAVMNRQPTQAALNPASRSLSLPSNPFPSPGIIPPPILPLSGTMPSVNGQAAVSLSSVVEKPHSVPLHSGCGQSKFPSSEHSSPSTSNGTLLPPYSSQAPSSSSPPAPTPGSLLSSSSSLTFLPQSPRSSILFPNPLASIAATANALDPLAALIKQRNAKLPSAPLFEPKPSSEEPFFKHKCRFCAKVFGSDSALQIHLRSHTGERPFKCNICGNRFSTKGNLKVHFQRHKDKFPQVQMNPFPVPEYLDNVPTSSGIPYGMSIHPEKPVSSWLDSKPVAAALPASVVLPLSSARVGGSNEAVSVTASVKSPNRTTPAECVSVSNPRGSEARISPASESNRGAEASKVLKTEVVHLPQSCTLTSSSIPTPEPDTSASPSSSPPPRSRSASLMDSMQTSETSKLQQLVENIDKKITDLNQCVVCRRILSCQSALKMHYRIHTGERPFKCRVCGRAFTTKGNLKTHVGVHRENPPILVQHSCPICQRKFTNAVVLQQHIRLHMVGPISDSAGLNGLQEVDNFDSLSSTDVSIEDEEEEEVENMEDGGHDSKAFISDCRSPLRASPAALENQTRMMDSTMGLNLSLTLKPPNGLRENVLLSTEELSPEKEVEDLHENSHHVSESSCSPRLSASSPQDVSESSMADNGLETYQLLFSSVKREPAEYPTSGASVQEERGELSVKEENLYSSSFQLSRDRAAGPNISSPISSASAGTIKAEVNGVIEAQLPHFSIAAVYPAPGSPGVAPLLGPAPPRRTPKQHNCHVCGKNFSSASALQIHERTHTGEKPFVCSVCGRAFTTKGNLKVHMGTHMWNNAPARRGRRLSVENPMALLGGEALKFGEVFQKDLATRAMNVDPGFWNRYAAAITSSLAMKNNEISVIQNRGLAQLHPLRASGGPMTGLSKTGVELGSNRHFSMLIDESKEIGIN
uniref:Sal-like protein 1 n=2 Tax=Iconisemion striatum TaxID=60296 RepID=A0A1A7Y2U9_9TELE